MENIDHFVTTWINGADDHFKKVFEVYYPKLYRYTLKYVRSSDIAEEIVMGVLQHVWYNRTSVDAGSMENFLFNSVKGPILAQLKLKTMAVMCSDIENAAVSKPILKQGSALKDAVAQIKAYIDKYNIL